MIAPVEKPRFYAWGGTLLPRQHEVLADFDKEAGDLLLPRGVEMETDFVLLVAEHKPDPTLFRVLPLQHLLGSIEGDYVTVGRIRGRAVKKGEHVIVLGIADDLDETGTGEGRN